MKRKHLKLTAALLMALPSLTSANALADDISALIKTTDGKTVEVKMDSDIMYGLTLYNRVDNKFHLVIASSNAYFDQDGNLTFHDISNVNNKVYFQSPLINCNSIRFLGTTAVDRIGDDSTISVRPADGKISITGVVKPVAVSIYSTDAMTLGSLTIDADTEINLSDFGNGLLIVTVDGTTFKCFAR